jgi:hypothetical protein
MDKNTALVENPNGSPVNMSQTNFAETSLSVVNSDNTPSDNTLDDFPEVQQTVDGQLPPLPKKYEKSLIKSISLRRKRTTVTPSLRTAAGSLAGYSNTGDIILLDSPITPTEKITPTATEAGSFFAEMDSNSYPKSTSSSPTTPISPMLPEVLSPSIPTSNDAYSPEGSDPDESPGSSNPPLLSNHEVGSPRSCIPVKKWQPVTRNTFILLLLQVLIIVPLEAVIMALHLEMVGQLEGFLGTWNIQQGTVPSARSLTVYHSLFILGQFWMIWLWTTAVRNHSGASVITLMIFNFYLLAFSIVQMVQSYKMLTDEQLEQIYMAGLPHFRYHASLPYEWAVFAVTLASTGAWLWGCRSMYKAFGWTVYRNHGADLMRRDRIKAKHMLKTLLDVLLYLIIGFDLQWIILEMDSANLYSNQTPQSTILSLIELPLSLLTVLIGYLATREGPLRCGRPKPPPVLSRRVAIEASGDGMDGIESMQPPPSQPHRPILLSLFLIGMLFLAGYLMYVLVELYSAPEDRFVVAKGILTFWVCATFLVLFPLVCLTAITLCVSQSDE